MVELPDNIESQIENIWFNSQRKFAEEKLAEIKEVMNGNFTLPQVREKVEDFNSIVDFICGENEQLYDLYRFRMFTKNEEVALIQRSHIVSEVDKIFVIGQETYNFADYNEIDVDVRHYREQ